MIVIPVLAIAAFFFGAYLLLFRKGRQRRGAFVMAVSPLVFVTGLFMFGHEQATSKGFSGLSDEIAAEKAGFTDSTAWIAQNAKIAANDKAAADAVATAAAAKQKAAADVAAAKAEQERMAAAAEQKAAADVAAAKAEQERMADAAEKAKEQKFGHQCLSLWDGSHTGFVRQVQSRLNDPESFEHDTTSTWPVTPDGRNTILMQFRARNGFGGTIRGRASGSFDNQSCEGIIVDFIE